MFAASKTASVSTGGYQISRSLRFNVPDSTNLNRTFASAGNRQTWTYSAWVKRSGLSTSDEGTIFSAGATDGAVIRFETANTLRLYDYSGGFSFNLITTQVFRDASAWYHIVLTYDSTQATSSDRTKLYVNGSQVTSFSTATYPSLNQNTYNFNNNVSHRIGNHAWDFIKFYSGYMTDVYFIDGQALTPSSFGETNAQTGVWQPKAYSGSYGTNGFYLNFSDNSNTTAATLGKDYSGNGNNWTPNNFSVTAGAGNDSLVDSPTSYGTDTGVGGTVRGNYCTLNPLQNGMTNAPRNGNLEIAGSAEVYKSLFGTFGVSTGKWYFEVVITSGSGVTNVAWSSTSNINQYAGEASTSYGYELENGNKIVGGGVTAYGSALTTNDVFMCAVDMDNLKLFFGKNGTWFASSDPVAGTSPAYTFAAGTYFFQMRPYTGSSSVVTTNFGQRPFAYTAPSGFKALCTQNLPTPTIGATTATQANKYFDTLTYTGNGSATQAITGLNFQPDFSWVKNRSNIAWYAVVDAVRTTSVQLDTTTTTDESNSINIKANYGGLSSFNSNGITVSSGSDGTYKVTNGSGQTYVAWNWKANGSGSTNTSGSITSTVSANTTSGFSVVNWTQPASGTYTIGHGLGVAPAMIIMKSRTAVSNWVVYHQSIGYTQYGKLNLNDGFSTDSNVWVAAPTSSVFSQLVNYGTGGTSIAYCFAEVAGYSKFGSYLGNNSSDGPFVYTGFRTAYLMVKRTDTSGYNWIVYDTTRNTYNVAGSELLPNTSDAEATYPILDFLSNGFKIRISATSVNASGGTYIFMAFASNPFKFSLAR